ncbi:MAG: FHA domain-containing protein [Sporichthyaceae bacterium]|jgi:pSer/pThr/pTyr-binding forkhead associated (FHA) protein
MVSYLQIGAGADLRMIALVGESMTVGRLEGNDIALVDDSVSRRHARLQFRSGSWILGDLSSSNGTWVNGERLSDAIAVRDGDEIRFGAVRSTFREEATAGYGEAAADSGPELTRRERDVLAALARHYDDPLSEPASTLAIAMALFVTEAAVKQHLLNLYRKFDVPAGAPGRRWALVDAAMRRGVLRAEEVRAV